MGHKVHPTGIRLGISKDWTSKWFATKKQYAGFLAADRMRRSSHRGKAVARLRSGQVRVPATACGPGLRPHAAKTDIRGHEPEGQFRDGGNTRHAFLLSHTPSRVPRLSPQRRGGASSRVRPSNLRRFFVL